MGEFFYDWKQLNYWCERSNFFFLVLFLFFLNHFDIIFKENICVFCLFLIKTVDEHLTRLQFRFLPQTRVTDSIPCHRIFAVICGIFSVTCDRFNSKQDRLSKPVTPHHQQSIPIIYNNPKEEFQKLPNFY